MTPGVEIYIKFGLPVKPFIVPAVLATDLGNTIPLIRGKSGKPEPERGVAEVGFIFSSAPAGLGGRGAEPGIHRGWSLRRWGGKMRPASSDGKMDLFSGPISARPGAAGVTRQKYLLIFSVMR